jgi:hypothetical protein
MLLPHLHVEYFSPVPQQYQKGIVLFSVIANGIVFALFGKVRKGSWASALSVSPMLSTSTAVNG